jgi:hypothetical protein
MASHDGGSEWTTEPMTAAVVMAAAVAAAAVAAGW